MITQQIFHREPASRFFFDTEFMDCGDHVELVSIGVVGCGREYHAVNANADFTHANAWVRENVIKHLPEDAALWKTPGQMRDELAALLQVGPSVEMWAWYGGYDWVLFCQLFGGMMALPSYIHQFVYDLKQYAMMLGNPVLPRQAGRVHDALEDARWNQQVYEFLRSM